MDCRIDSFITSNHRPATSSNHTGSVSPDMFDSGADQFPFILMFAKKGGWCLDSICIDMLQNQKQRSSFDHQPAASLTMFDMHFRLPILELIHFVAIGLWPKGIS